MKKNVSIIVCVVLLISLLTIGCNNDRPDIATENPVIDESDTDSLTHDEPTGEYSEVNVLSALEVVLLFSELAKEMENGNHTTTKERLIELFDEPSVDEEFMLYFEPAADVGIFASLLNGVVVYISLDPIPDFFIDENLVPNYEQLLHYNQNPEGFTLEYFESLFNRAGNIISYGAGLFTFDWRSSEFIFSVDVTGDNEVVFVQLRNLSENGFGLNENFDQMLVDIPNEVRQVMIDLAEEMEQNNGVIAPVRAKEILSVITTDFDVNNQILIFPVLDGVNIAMIVEETDMIESVFMSLNMNLYYVESLLVSIEELERLEESTEGLSLQDITELFGSSGVLEHYIFNEFTFAWRTPNLTVQVRVDQDGNIFDFIVIPFFG